MGWLDKLKPRKYAVIDGRLVTEPIYLEGDTTFTVKGASDWGSTSKYNVHLNGPESYYEYKTLTAPKDDASSGGNVLETIIIKGNDPERLNRYRMYERMLTPEDYKSWWQHMFSKTPEKAYGGKVLKGGDGMITSNISKPMDFNITRRQSPVQLTSGYAKSFQVMPETGKMQETTEYFNPDGTIKTPIQTIKTGKAWINPETMEIWSPSGYGLIKGVNTKPLILKGYKGIKTNRPTDISNITDDLVANLMYDRSMLGGENTKLELGTNYADPYIWLYGDSTSTVDGSKWKVQYRSKPGGISTTDPTVFSRSAREVDDKGNFTGKKEYRSFNYFYPEPEKPNSNSDAHNMAAKNGGTYTYSGNKENYLENKFYTDLYKRYLLYQKSGGKLYNEDLITAIKACGGKMKKKK